MRISIKLTAVGLGILFFCACKQVDLYERLQNIEGGNWKSTQMPALKFTIKDTSASYRVYVVIRHTNLYPYRNIWLNIGLQQPGDAALKYQFFDVPLAASDRWLGTGMDDVYECRQLLFPLPVKFSKPGDIQFVMQQAMRINPLPAVLQAGIRVEKAE